MKIAYLIAAHNDPGHLKRLISALNISGVTDFYIHLDKRADIKDFNLLGGDYFNTNFSAVGWIFAV